MYSEQTSPSPGPVTAVDVGNVTEYTLAVPVEYPSGSYSITVRAYQDLLGPASAVVTAVTEQSEIDIHS